MKQLIFILSLVLLGVFAFFSCKKWTDPTPVNDPRLTNPYCNDPTAVNYNWGFPGKPNNTVCFYPTDVFRGSYMIKDTVFQVSTGYILYSDSFVLQVYALSHTKIAALGFCSAADSLKLTAGLSYIATLDTLVGDSVTNQGQFWCRLRDTVSGTMYDSPIDSLLHINFQIVSDTGITTHIGTGKKL